MKLYLAHTVTPFGGGTVCGIFRTPEAAKEYLRTHHNFRDGEHDWSWFVQPIETNTGPIHLKHSNGNCYLLRGYV